MSPRTWSLLTVEGIRQYGGNAGYLDDPAKIYRYDSDVANYRQLQQNDIVLLRSKTNILGIGKIEKIVAGEGNKERLRCPVCQATNIKERLRKQPRWGCKNGHTFEEPTREYTSVQTFEAHYENTFRTVHQDLTTALLHNAVLRPSDQMSIKEVDLAKIEAILLRDPACKELVLGYATAIVVENSEELESDVSLSESIIEARRRVLREISLRRGQAQFRQRLIRRYGNLCQVSRCAFPPLVEAAHILPYGKTGDNSVHNGLLLRSDLHTLFDLGLLAVHPRSMTIGLHPTLLRFGYASFEDTQLFINGTHGPDREALWQRWEFFETRLKSNA
jgi:putative restriction endonuclease